MRSPLPRDALWGAVWVVATWLLAIAVTAMLVSGLGAGVVR